MKAYKCDRCGEFFLNSEYGYAPSKFYITRTPNASGHCLDLCPNCNDELQEWIAKGEEQAVSIEKVAGEVKIYHL